MILGWMIALFFPTTQIQLGEQTLIVEIANTDEARYQGLMGRASLESDRGMLFVFEKPQTLFFWMKDTQVPLSIAFFDKDKKLINISHMAPLPPGAAAYPRYHSLAPAVYALEVNQGWFQKNGIHPDMKFSFLD